MNIINAIISGILEGLTEFLPVSSTGHLILAHSAMGIREDEFVKSFQIAIQLGAILAVVVVYYKRFFQNLELYKKLIVAFIPTWIAGYLLRKMIREYLFNTNVVGVSLVLGGVILLFADRLGKKNDKPIEKPEDIGMMNAFLIGVFQCIAMIPGISRAAATIIGGIYVGFEKKTAVEFSFLLAIPTMFAATGYDLLKTDQSFDAHQWTMIGLGGFTAFVCALMVVKSFIPLIEKYGFRAFGFYRIILGLAFLSLSYFGLLQLTEA